MATFTVHTIDNAPEASKPILQAVMETKRQLDVLDRRLDESPYLAGDQYTIADIAVGSWYGKLVLGDLYSAAEFISAHEYTNVQRWAEVIANRPAVIRGQRVNRTWGDEATQVPERHDANDLG